MVGPWRAWGGIFSCIHELDAGLAGQTGVLSVSGNSVSSPVDREPLNLGESELTPHQERFPIQTVPTDLSFQPPQHTLISDIHGDI